MNYSLPTTPFSLLYPLLPTAYPGARPAGRAAHGGSCDAAHLTPTLTLTLTLTPTPTLTLPRRHAAHLEPASRQLAAPRPRHGGAGALPSYHPYRGGCTTALPRRRRYVVSSKYLVSAWLVRG